MQQQSQEKILSDVEKHEFESIPLNIGKSATTKFALFFGILLLFLGIFFALNLLTVILSQPIQRITNSKGFNLDSKIKVQSKITKYYETNINLNYPKIDDYSAKSIVIYDVSSNRNIYEKNPDQKLFIASLTKLASVKILSEDVNPNDITVISEEAAKYTGSPLEMKTGQAFSNQDLIKASVIVSSNQAVYALQDPEKTVKEMNNYAKILKCKTTNFSNPAGFDDDNNNYSSAKDVVPFAKIFFENNLLKDYASTIKSEITDLSTSSTIKIVNTDELLRNDYYQVIAGKTGTTPKAGQNLTLLIEKNNRRYIVVIIGSTDRYKDAMMLIDRI